MEIKTNATKQRKKSSQNEKELINVLILSCETHKTWVTTLLNDCILQIVTVVTTRA